MSDARQNLATAWDRCVQNRNHGCVFVDHFDVKGPALSARAHAPGQGFVHGLFNPKFGQRNATFRPLTPPTEHHHLYEVQQFTPGQLAQLGDSYQAVTKQPLRPGPFQVAEWDRLTQQQAPKTRLARWFPEWP
jgi:hypothetical protein